MPDPELVGVGIDVEESGACSRLGPEALGRAAARWLTREEREWCAAQPSLAESLVVLLSCKEAVYKAWPGAGAPHEVRLTVTGSAAGGRGRAGRDPVTVAVEWHRWRGRVVALAVATRSPAGPGSVSPLQAL